MRDMDDPKDSTQSGATFDRSYRALEYAFRIRTPLPRLAAVVDDLLSPFRSEDVNGARAYTLTQRQSDGLFALWLDGQCLDETATAGGLVHSLLWEVHKQAVASAREVLALHAGAVAWRGAGVVLPGTTGSGKTTLVTGLIKAGFSYLSDEAALIEPQTGWLHPFPKSLTLRPESLRLLPELTEKLAPELAWTTRLRYHLSADAVRADALGGPCIVRYVITPTYTPGSQVRLVPVSRAQTLVDLSRNAFNLHLFGRVGVAVLADVVRGAECFHMQVGDLESAVDAVKTLVAAEHRIAAGR
jgi:hypothetical protein